LTWAAVTLWPWLAGLVVGVAGWVAGAGAFTSSSGRTVADSLAELPELAAVAMIAEVG
jgi:hypothetical protein